MDKEAFVYLWHDAPNKKYYLGKHKGTPDDSYTHSSTIWESFTKNAIPEGVTRRILAYGTDEEMCILEHELLVNRKKRCWDRYYNESLGDPRYVDVSGELNPNFKTGKYVGRLREPALYKKLDAEKHKETWSKNRKQGCPRMMFFYYKKRGNKTQAEQSWNEWYSKAKFKSNNRQALQKTDTFKLWYNRIGNDLNFRKKIV